MGLKPLYITGSGGIQPSDMLYILMFGMLFIGTPSLNTTDRTKQWLFFFYCTILYQFIIQIVWQIVTDMHAIYGNMIPTILYYVFNFFVVCAVIKLNEIVGYEKLTDDLIVGTILSCIVCLAGIAIKYEQGLRQTGFFNNPNQLGYYSVIVYTIAILFRERMNRTNRLFIVLCSWFFSIVSLSKAAILSILLMILLSTIARNSNKLSVKGFLAIAFTISMLCILSYMVLYSDAKVVVDNQEIMSIRNRMMTTFTENDSSLGSGRGYDRIREIGSNVIFGVGEGKYQRFTTMKGYETHSTYAALLVSYGFVGLASYAYIILYSLRSKNKVMSHYIAFSGIIIYSVTHNGIRNTILWTIIAMLMLWQEQNTSSEKNAALQYQYADNQTDSIG